MKDYKLYDEVIIKSTGEHAFIVDIDSDPEHDSVLLEIKGKDEMPKFYKRAEFDLV